MAMTAVFTNFNGRLVHEKRGGTERGYVPDPLGSTKALVDSSGAIQDAWEYWPYGEVESHTGTSTTQFTFVGTLGYFRDLVSKLTYIRARYYQAFIGQWMTKDQLWPPIDAYQYCNDDPMRYNDPTGLIRYIHCDADDQRYENFKLMCENIIKCYKIPSCRGDMSGCWGGKPDKAQCMYERCSNILPLTVVCDNGSHICKGNCGRALAFLGLCRIWLCPDCSSAKACDTLQRTNFHELAHCCGAHDAPDGQAECVAKCMERAVFGWPTEPCHHIY